MDINAKVDGLDYEDIQVEVTILYEGMDLSSTERMASLTVIFVFVRLDVCVVDR